MKISGIYKIQSKATGKIYIGESLNIKKRKIRHFTDLRQGKHTNLYLQRHINKYGIGDMTFDIIEELPSDKEHLSKREIFWIKFYRSNEVENGFNLNKGGLGGTVHTIIHRNFTLVNIKTEKIEEYQTISDFEEKNNIHIRHKIRDVILGKRKVSLGFTTVDNFYKLKKSKEIRENSKLKPKPLPPINSRKFEILNTNTNVVFSGDNVAKFCKENKLNYICLLRVINGKRKKYKNWRLP